jgi:hypothetical protein
LSCHLNALNVGIYQCLYENSVAGSYSSYKRGKTCD